MTKVKESTPGTRHLLKNQKALVTGASSGIGQSVAIALAEAGANVVVNYARDDAGAKKTIDEIKAANSNANCYFHKADVSKEAEVQEMFQKMIKEFGAIDILVSNAGLQRDAKLVDMTFDEWSKVINVNLTGQFLCAREAVKQFIKQGVREEISKAAGKIICMSSVHQVIPWAGHVNYAASKGGIHMMMKTIAQEVAEHRIRVNSICPGAIRTNINKNAWETKEAYENLMTVIPYNRIGEPEEIGRACAWLASDQADYIVGNSLFVDGGMTLYPGFIDKG